MRRRGRGETTERTQRGLVRHGSAAAGGPCPDRFGVRLRRRRGRRPHAQWYSYEEPGGSFVSAAERCSEASDGRYRIELVTLPNNADEQREQLVRRLAAEDSDIDLISMDVIWTAEFAEAGWILPFPTRQAQQVTEGRLEPAVPDAPPTRTGCTRRRSPATPSCSGTATTSRRDPPTTWEAELAETERLEEAGKPPPVQVQGQRYEGLVVWFTSLLESAGDERPRTRAAPKVDARAEGHREGARGHAGPVPLVGRAARPVHGPRGRRPPGVGGRRLGLHGQLHVRLAQRERRTRRTSPRTWAGPGTPAIEGGGPSKVDDRRVQPRRRRLRRASELAFDAAACITGEETRSTTPPRAACCRPPRRSTTTPSSPRPPRT